MISAIYSEYLSVLCILIKSDACKVPPSCTSFSHPKHRHTISLIENATIWELSLFTVGDVDFTGPNLQVLV